jgi:putative FmdB family regulatory protein
MPIYEFECPNGIITAKLVNVGTEAITCPKCHKKAKKTMSVCIFELKGGGWFAEGYSHRKEGKGAKKHD